MKYLYLIHSFILVEGTVNLAKFCDFLADPESKQCYVKESLISIAHSPNQLAIDKVSNTLYFSFDAGQGEYVPAVFKIDTKKLSVLKGIKDAFAIAHDSNTGETYFGGSHGIYRYDSIYKSLKRLYISNLDVWWLVIKKNIYFIKFPSLNAFYYNNRTVKSMEQLKNRTVHQFLFDLDDNMFFINSSGLFGVKDDSTQAIMLRDNPRFLGMALDNKGHVYVSSEDGIFIVSKLVQKVKKVVNIQGVLGMAFDKNNNIIYSDSHELVRLVPVSKDKYYFNARQLN